MIIVVKNTWPITNELTGLCVPNVVARTTIRVKTSILAVVETATMFIRYCFTKETYRITQEKSRGSENFELIHRFIYGLKHWLIGIYHSVHSRCLQVYLDKYAYRFNRNLWKEFIFDNLIKRMEDSKPSTYKDMITNIST